MSEALSKTSSPARASWTSEVAARRLLWTIFFLFALVQVWRLHSLGNDLGTDVHSESDALRSADAYAREGLWSHHGLPRILHGALFPKVGTVLDHTDASGLVPEKFRKGFPAGLAHRDAWVYTHYPPGPNLLCGLWAKICGLERLWVLRLFPLVFGLGAVAFFFWALARAFDPARALVLAGACAVLPMFGAYLIGLHYQGYSLALLLVQLALLLRIFRGRNRCGAGLGAAFFTLGFLQGWLSFDQFFVVSLLAVPFWCLRREEGDAPSFKLLLWLVALPSAGFILAHGLHFLQVAAELGGLRAALGEFHATAAERAGTTGGEFTRYHQFLGRAVYLYFRDTVKPTNAHFGPLILLAAGWVTVLAARGRKLPWRALTAALVISVLWMLFMPQHAVSNLHVSIRHLFVFYFFLLLVVAGGGTRRSMAPPQTDLSVRSTGG